MLDGGIDAGQDDRISNFFNSRHHCQATRKRKISVAKMALGRKLSVGQAAVTIFILMASTVSISSVWLLSKTVTNLYDHTHDELGAIYEAADTLSENRIAEAYLVGSGGARGGDLLRRRRAEMAEQLAVLDGLLRDETLRPQLRELEGAWASYLQSQSVLVRLAREGRLEQAKALYEGEVEDRYNVVDQLTDALIRKIDNGAKHQGKDAEALGWWSAILVLFLCGASLLVTIIVQAVGRERIGKPVAHITRSLSRLAGGDMSVEVAGAERDDEIGEMVRALEVFRSNAKALEQAHRETREAQAEAEALARHDALTGLANRRLFVEALSRLDQAESSGPVALLMIDLDRFKPVNDAYGHQAGDEVLCSLANRLNMLSDDATVARLGGDEFAMLVPLQHGSEDAVRACETIQHAVQEPFAIGDAYVEIGATIGVALFPQDGRDASTLLRAADLAMYQAKSIRRGSYRFFEAAMQMEVDQRARFDAELQTAIKQQQIRPYYQPLVASDHSEVVGFEVLARWEHPQRGLIMPDEFIPAAEERGLLPELTSHLLRRACLDAREWPGHMRLSINMSPSQLRDPMLPIRMIAILQETGVRPQRIEVEVTENALVSDLEATKHVLASLQNLGMTVALDDFGTGYSSLYHLRELKFDKIKVDKSFVQAIEDNGEKSKIVHAMINLGKSLGLTTTAEGIEEVEQWTQLQDWGCDFGQGFLFGRAMPPEQVDAFLSQFAGSDGADSRKKA